MTEKGFKEEKEESYKERSHRLSILGFAKVCKHSRNHSLGVNKLENDRKKNPRMTQRRVSLVPQSLLFCFDPRKTCVDPAAAITPQHRATARPSVFESCATPSIFVFLQVNLQRFCWSRGNSAGATLWCPTPDGKGVDWCISDTLGQQPRSKMSEKGSSQRLSNTHEPSAWEISSFDCFVHFHE